MLNMLNMLAPIGCGHNSLVAPKVGGRVNENYLCKILRVTVQVNDLHLPLVWYNTLRSSIAVESVWIYLLS